MIRCGEADLCLQRRHRPVQHLPRSINPGARPVASSARRATTTLATQRRRDRRTKMRAFADSLDDRWWRSVVARRCSTDVTLPPARAGGWPRPTRRATSGTRWYSSVRVYDAKKLDSCSARAVAGLHRRLCVWPGPRPPLVRMPPPARRPSTRSSGGSARWRCPSRLRHREPSCWPSPCVGDDAQRRGDDLVSASGRAQAGHDDSSNLLLRACPIGVYDLPDGLDDAVPRAPRPVEPDPTVVALVRATCRP